MDTFSDPFSAEVTAGVAFIVVFKPVSGGVVIGAGAGVVVACTVLLFAGATQPADTINPTAINRARGTISFIRGFFHEVCFLLNYSKYIKVPLLAWQPALIRGNSLLRYHQGDGTLHDHRYSIPLSFFCGFLKNNTSVRYLTMPKCGLYQFLNEESAGFSPG